MIKDLKDLRKLIQLCRKEGVDIIKIGDIEMHIPAGPTKQAKPTKARGVQLPKPPQGEMAPHEEPENDELTPEQMLFYSVRTPEEQQQN
jgi:hypothetical protein